MAEPILSLKNISKGFNGKLVLDQINIDIDRNEFITLLGPSGCGKSTTLRIIGGFEHPDEGRVLFEGADITDTPPERRNVNTVFQRYSLFPHYNVEKNIAFGLKLKKKSKAYIRDKVSYALKLVSLDGFEKRAVDSLSGGQQQRVAIARAIVNEPEILLLDEPLGALDLKLRRGMQQELIAIKKEVGITFIYVTHDQEEAMTMSDRIVVMNQGIIQQMGTPQEIYDEPQNAFVADFVGESNIVDGIMRRDRLVEIFGIPVSCVDSGFGRDEAVDVVIRPEDIEIVPAENGLWSGTITDITYKGAYYDIKVQSGAFCWSLQRSVPVMPGERVGLYVIPSNIQIMKKPTSGDEEVIREDEEPIE